jgi:hypothetical protein
MLITIFPFEIVHVAGLGFGTITTVAQVPVPPPEQSGSVANLTVAFIVPVAFGQPAKVYVTLIATTVPALPLGLNLLPVTPAPANVKVPPPTDADTKVVRSTLPPAGQIVVLLVVNVGQEPEQSGSVASNTVTTAVLLNVEEHEPIEATTLKVVVEVKLPVGNEIVDPVLRLSTGVPTVVVPFLN